MSPERVIAKPRVFFRGPGWFGRRSWLRWSVVLGLIGFCAASGYRLSAGPAHIDRIEPFLSDQVTIHFDTEANRKYELQFFHRPTGVWSNLFEAPKVPFPNHYIIVDYRTNEMRIYRLRVTP